MQAIDNAQVDKLVTLAQQYGPDITRLAIRQVYIVTVVTGKLPGTDNSPR